MEWICVGIKDFWHQKHKTFFSRIKVNSNQKKKNKKWKQRKEKNFKNSNLKSKLNNVLNWF